MVCPHFAPSNGADGHRVRLYAAGLAERGWQLDVLACDPRDLPINTSPELLRSLPDVTRVHHVPSRPTVLGRLAGASTTGRNAYRFIRAAGDQLLSKNTYRGVFFSTTAFRLLPLAQRWRKRFSVPYVVDLQDPWFQTYYRDHRSVVPPGGRLRFALANAHARRHEAAVLSRAAGVVTVSPAYQKELRARHTGLAQTPFLTLPFGASTADVRVARETAQSFFDPQDGRIHLAYVGRGGEDLWPAFAPLFTALKAATERRIHLHCIGTSYAPPGRETPSLKPLAEQLGVADRVSEYPARIDYFEALRCLQDTHGIVLPASSDPGYNASKVHNTVLCGPPVLGLVHEDSVAQQLWTGLAPQLELVTVGAEAASAAVQRWLSRLPQPSTLVTDYPFEARHQAQQLAGFLEQVI